LQRNKTSLHIVTSVGYSIEYYDARNNKYQDRNFPLTYIFIQVRRTLTIPVAARSKMRVCGRTIAWIVGSNPAGAWMHISSECCVVSSWRRCDGPATRPDKSYRVWCGVSECDREAWIMERPWPSGGCCAMGDKDNTINSKYSHRCSDRNTSLIRISIKL
jgi:hypothetical protein